MGRITVGRIGMVVRCRARSCEDKHAVLVVCLYWSGSVGNKEKGGVSDRGEVCRWG